MIVESSINVVFWIIGRIFSAFEMVALPVNIASTVIDFMKVGAWVLGSDLLTACLTSIVMWLLFKFSAGLILFIYKLLPFT